MQAEREPQPSLQQASPDSGHHERVIVTLVIVIT